jgi:hypothetical protein
MALILLEEVLVGLEEAKMSLDQAVLTLADMSEDLHPDLQASVNVKNILEQNFVQPLQQRAAQLEHLLEELALACDEPM